MNSLLGINKALLFWRKTSGFADLCLIPQLYNARRFDIKVEQFPRLEMIEKKCLETPSCQKSHPEKFKPLD